MSSNNISTIVGESIPPQTKHAVSVCLPTWKSNVGYEEHDPEVISRLTTGYPRFFIHKSIQKLCSVLIEKYAIDNEREKCLVFSSYNVAKRCREYIKVRSPKNKASKVRILQLSTCKPNNPEEEHYKQECKVSVVFVDQEDFPFLKEYWQHTGEGISSRVAEYVLKELFLAINKEAEKNKGHIQDETANTLNQQLDDDENFVEQRFGRSLDMSMGARAKLLIKRRIARKVVDVDDEGGTTASADNGRTITSGATGNINEFIIDTTSRSTNHGTDSRSQSNNINTSDFTHYNENGEEVEVFNITNSIEENTISDNVPRGNVEVQPSPYKIDSEKDVYLFPSGMAAIFTAHRLLLELDSLRVNRKYDDEQEQLPHSKVNRVIGYGAPYKKTVMFGFPYTDTLSILRKFNHTHFLPNDDAMERLQEILQSGEQILAVFCETPSNPLLKMGDLLKLHDLSLKYGFYIVVDDTIGGFVNLDVLPHADIVVSSLTKIFSGDSNVLAGSLILNPKSRLYDFAINSFFSNADGSSSYEDLLWCEDAICLERNSRDFIERALKVNVTTEWLITEVLLPYKGKLFRNIYYPTLTNKETKENYDAVKTIHGGYGEVFSLVFFEYERAILFFDNLKLCKGPSLGTNFTLSCPYAIIAHYAELEEVAKYGVDKSLVRVSVGLESPEYLRDLFQYAIDKAME
ncbi:related to Cystathionine gamma-synthase [Saccharomycodes ludwigii]|uniref:cystathionine gamma-synthase n=1 Tax=Saccharomycodes ludwigii TaxID=36035 RepID=A0A376B8D1_9ASCO|nr:hypothetical protein SCDLUD_004363 [Saccharomycodes ludwigii]KAH3900046.1 hypothetical protein SCDLUD_004363 [Saccharomycodes ludwigii]SSD60871.1 related to Cystathionine gamma-synthase [Saccharomycodes ludwigii]